MSTASLSAREALINLSETEIYNRAKRVMEALTYAELRVLKIETVFKMLEVYGIETHSLPVGGYDSPVASRSQIDHLIYRSAITAAYVDLLDRADERKKAILSGIRQSAAAEIRSALEEHAVLCDNAKFKPERLTLFAKYFEIDERDLTRKLYRDTCIFYAQIAEAFGEAWKEVLRDYTYGSVREVVVGEEFDRQGEPSEQTRICIIVDWTPVLGWIVSVPCWLAYMETPNSVVNTSSGHHSRQKAIEAGYRLWNEIAYYNKSKLEPLPLPAPIFPEPVYTSLATITTADLDV